MTETAQIQKSITKNKPTTKMKVWMFAIDSFNYSTYQLPNAKDREFFTHLCLPQLLKGKAIGDTWKPLVFLKKRQRRNTDFTVIENAGIAISKKALTALNPLIEKNIEILPLKTLAREPFYFINCLNVMDALDEEKSIFQYSSVSRTKIGITKFVFDEKKIKDKHIFKLNDFKFNTFVSDEFRAICKQNDLQGLDFSRNKLLWKQTQLTNKKPPKYTTGKQDDFSHTL